MLSEIKKYIKDYTFAPESELEEGIWYMNGNDGTAFDWEMNDRVCEFLRFYKSTELGHIKVSLCRNGELSGYTYDEEGRGRPSLLPSKNIGSEKAEKIYNWLLNNADDKGLFDRPLSEIETDTCKMTAVIMVHNFDHEVVTTLFESEEDARDYHKWLYNSYLQEEKDEKSDLDEEQCIYSEEERYAKVTWKDECVTEFIISDIYKPLDDYEGDKNE